MSSAPVWLFAVALALLAPFAVGALQGLLERRLRRRTLDVLTRAGVNLPDKRP